MNTCKVCKKACYGIYCSIPCRNSDPEYIERMGRGVKGSFDESRRLVYSERAKEQWQTPDIRTRMIKELRKRCQDSEVKFNRSERAQLQFQNSEQRELRRRQQLVCWSKPEYVELHRGIGIATEANSDRIDFHRTLSIALWKDEGYAQKVLSGLKLKPNKPELFLIQLIEENKLPFEYVGNGKLILNGYCPDFVHNCLPRVVEFFGEYWHTLDEVPERQKRFNDIGYELLIIWEWELEDVVQVISRLQIFASKGGDTNGIEENGHAELAGASQTTS